MSLLIFLFGFLAGGLLLFLIYRVKKGSFHYLAEQILRKAELDADNRRKNLEFELKEKQCESNRRLNTIVDEAEKKISKEKEKIMKREEKLDSLMLLVEKKIKENEKKENYLKEKKIQIDGEEKRILSIQDQSVKELERISQLSASQARDLLFERIENNLKREASGLANRITKEAKENAEKEAKRIIATSINRLAISCSNDLATTSLSLPSDEMKGRIIGREGRNIRTLEQATGVNFLIDDTPGAVVISGFDPIRKQIAKTALSELMQDGRIHPTRILEAVENAKIRVDGQIIEFGEDASIRAGVFNLHPALIELLGKLYFRISYGQQVLDHSVEVAHILGLMASEIGLDIALAKRMGLLHDIGKALSHENEGSHAMIGHDIALKYGETEMVANGIGCHHGEMPAQSILASLVSAADAISGGRLGARSDSIEQYIKRLRTLEKISQQFPGVHKAFALQAGREICVIVTPDEVDDATTHELAKNIAKNIEKEMTYPGRIKVTVIREKKAIEYAT